MALTETPLLIFLFGKPNTGVKGLDCVRGSTTAEPGELSPGQKPDAVDSGLGLLCSAPPGSEGAPRHGMALSPSSCQSSMCPKKTLYHHPPKRCQILPAAREAIPSRGETPQDTHPKTSPKCGAAVPRLYWRAASRWGSAGLQPAVLNSRLPPLARGEGSHHPAPATQHPPGSPAPTVSAASAI